GDCGRDQARVDRRVAARVKRELVVEGGAAAGEVEVAVLAEIDDRRAIGRRAVVDAPDPFAPERVADGCLQPAREALVAVVALERQLEGDAAVTLARQRLDLPPTRAEAGGSA